MRYSYECKECGHEYELDVPIDERDEPCRGLCSKCDGPIRRVLEAPRFVLKGSCWARDNYIRDHDKAEYYNKKAEES